MEKKKKNLKLNVPCTAAHLFILFGLLVNFITPSKYIVHECINLFEKSI